MQAVLSVDLTSVPARAEVIEVEGRSLRVVESCEFDVGDLLATIPHSELAHSKDQIAAAEEPPPASPSEGEVVEQIKEPLQTPLSKLISGIKTPWTSSILIVPPPSYLSLNIDLPFIDQKSIGKILALEVQDRIPFEVSEFLVEYRALGALPPRESDGGAASPGYDIHVSLVPRDYMRTIVKLCKASDFEPLIITTATATLGGAYHVAPDFMAPDSAVVYSRGLTLFVAMAHGGVVKSDRVLSRTVPPEVGTTLPQEVLNQLQKSLLTDLKLTLSGFESRYGISISKIYYAGGDLAPESLQQNLSRPIELLPLDSFTRPSETGTPVAASLATLGAVFIQDVEPPTILTNFRINEFSYSPRLKEVYRGLKTLAPYILFTLLLGLMTLGALFYSRGRYIDQVKQSLANQIKAAMPDAEVPPGLEIEALRGQLNRLQDQLKDLGSLSKFSPLDSLVELTKDFPFAPDISIRTVNIKNSRIKVEGTAPNYEAAEKIEKALKAKRDTYARIKTTVSDTVAPGTTGRSFTLEIFLVE